MRGSLTGGAMGGGGGGGGAHVCRCASSPHLYACGYGREAYGFQLRGGGGGGCGGVGELVTTISRHKPASAIVCITYHPYVDMD